MYTKEQVINEIKRIAEKLGVKYLEQKDFEKNSTITMNTVRYFLGTWKQAIDVTGLEAPDAGKKLDDVDEEDLLLDLIRLYKEFGETPSLMLIKKQGKYHERLYAAKWNTVSDAFRRARRKYPHKLATPSPSLKKEINYDEKLDEVLDDHEKTDEINKNDLLKGKDPMDFEGLLYEGKGDNKPREEKPAPSPKKSPKKEPQKKKDDSPKPEELDVDPNEITQVHSAKKLLEMRPPRDKKKEPKESPVVGEQLSEDLFDDLEKDFKSAGDEASAREPNGDEKEFSKDLVEELEMDLQTGEEGATAAESVGVEEWISEDLLGDGQSQDENPGKNAGKAATKSGSEEELADLLTEKIEALVARLVEERLSAIAERVIKEKINKIFSSMK